MGNESLGSMLFKNYDDLVLNGSTPILQQKRKDILDMLAAAIAAVEPSRVVKELFHGSQMVFPAETIDLSSFDHLFLVGFGKASVGMAQAVCDAVTVTKGVVITNDPSAKITHDYIEVIVGGHPLPNIESIRGADKILGLLGSCGEDDVVIVVISGGGSSLFCKPRIPLIDLQETVNLLLRSGATIDEINTIRKHLSLVKGGQLAQQTKAVVLSLIISDVVLDPISSIASGPTAPDPTTYSDAKEILTRYNLWSAVSAAVRSLIEEGIAGDIPETVKENDPIFDKIFNFIVANNEHACQGALTKALELGYDAKLITSSMTGEARILGRYLISRVKTSLSQGSAAFITGGEPTVKLRGVGTGGRNQELVLSSVKEIAGTDMVIASFATDGIDGNSKAAGALADGFTSVRALKKNLHISSFLGENNSYVFFDGLGDALFTGPTGTNVMDIQIILQ
ncbi:MAG TPA: glycerate kinase [Thermoplasmata archaeon]|nr:MAG TPA: glycerate kinase [Thermoplasmata archaeon]